MSENPTPEPTIPWTTILTAMTAIGSIVWLLAPLNSSRPAGDGSRSNKPLGYFDVDARLWQDPLSAALEHSAAADEENFKRKQGGEKPIPDPVHSINELAEQLASAPGAILLPVMVEYGSYSEASEVRRRLRNAVICGLHRADYAPDDSDHIGYFKIAWPRLDKTVMAAPIDFSIKAGLREPTADEISLVVPYETCHKNGSTDRVIILWLDESEFADKPLHRLARLLSEIRVRSMCMASPVTTDKIRILGPHSSTTLLAMVQEAAALDPTDWVRTQLNQVRMLGASTTAEDQVLTYGLPEADPAKPLSVKDRLAASGLRFERTIDTDLKVFGVLVQELEARGVKFGKQPGDRKDLVAIISECDTLYGRVLPIEFKAAARGKDCKALPGLIGDESTLRTRPPPGVIDDGEKIVRVSYFRGLDGKLPADPRKQRGDNDASESNSKKSASDSGAQKPPIEDLSAGEGQSQFDYVRRLADELERLDADDQAQRGPLYGLRAIGVMGSDVYDKLVILQALRRRFPAVIFFTTDMDARLADPAQWKWTHNLIVASSYGLTVRDEIQQDILPFRDSYQTSFFCGTLRAIDAWKDAAPGKGILSRLDQQPPRICEIAHSGAYDLSFGDPEPNSDQSQTDVQPHRSDPRQWLHDCAWRTPTIIGAATFGICLVIGTLRSRHRHRHPTPPVVPPGLFIAASFFVPASLVYLWIASCGIDYLEGAKLPAVIQAANWTIGIWWAIAVLVLAAQIRSGLPAYLPRPVLTWLVFMGLYAIGTLGWLDPKAGWSVLIGSLVIFALFLAIIFASEGKFATPFAIIACLALALTFSAIGAWQNAMALKAVCVAAGTAAAALPAAIIIVGVLDRVIPVCSKTQYVVFPLGIALLIVLFLTAVFTLIPHRATSDLQHTLYVQIQSGQWRDVLRMCDGRFGLRFIFWVLPPVTIGALLIRANWQMLYLGRIDFRPQIFAAVLVGILVVFIIHAVSYREEPFALVEGISIWPTEIIRCVAAVLGLHFLIVSYARMKWIERSLESTYDLTNRVQTQDAIPNEEVDSTAAWASYTRHRGKTIARTACFTCLYLLFGLLVTGLLGVPRIPHRGLISLWIDQITFWVTAVVLASLTFLVVDVTFRVAKLVRDLTHYRTLWPEGPLLRKAMDRRMEMQDLDDYLSIRFVAKLTKIVMSLIYYPFAVLALMIFARLGIFANWNWPPSVFVLVGLISAYAISSAWMLWRAAERAEKNALRHLRQKQIEIADTDANRSQRLKWTIEEITEIREGAFASFLHNPVVHALVLPVSAAIGGIVEYVAKGS